MLSSLAKPTTIGRYDVTGVIGRGGMGTVYKANDRLIGRAVAIKVLTGTHGQDSELLARFYREAKYTGSLQHPNIVTVYELGDQDGLPYLVMEYLEGESLDSIIGSRRPLHIAEKLDIVIQVCSGLSYAHAQGVVHRDIKPANIVILGDGTAKIVDFGIARWSSARKGLTRTGEVLGSIYYMSLEQLNGNVELDLRTDVYSTGVVLFQLLTGSLPFEGQDTGSTLLKILHDPPPPLSNFLPQCPPELEAITQKALAKDRKDRFASAEDFAFDLKQVQQNLSREMLAQYLQKAASALRAKDFATARENLIRVLRIDRQNSEAERLLAGIERAMELEKQEQQAREQRAREEAERFDSFLSRAEVAFEQGDLAVAKKAIQSALALRPTEDQARSLEIAISTAAAEQARREKASEIPRQFALAVNTVEKAMADARMLLFLNQPRDASQALDKVEDGLSQLPPELRSQFERLRAEVRRRLAGSEPSEPQTAVGRADSGMQESFSPPGLDSSPRTTVRFEAPGVHDTLPPSRRVTVADRAPRQPDIPDIPQELREFLPPSAPNWHRQVLWASISAITLVLLLYGWLLSRPKPRPAAAPSSPATVPSAPPRSSDSSPPDSPLPTSYVAINAEPWGTVRSVVADDGTAVQTPNQQTPVRLILPGGRYTVIMEGPQGESKHLRINVPSPDGKTYFVIFHEPDIGKIIGQP